MQPAIPYIIPLLIAMFLAINMGASGTSPSFSAAYGANIIRKQFIPGLFGIMVFAGALIAGSKVSLTMGKGLLDASFFTPYVTSVVLFCTVLSIFFANLIGIPQSTSQSTVLAIAGAATALGSLKTDKLFLEIIPTWLILPMVSFFIMLGLLKFVFPHLKKTIAGFNPQNNNKSKAITAKVVIIIASSYVAFSIGSNNVANAAGPIASLTINELGAENLINVIPVTILSMLLVAPCFAIGSSLLGHKVTEKTGKDIIDVDPFHAMVISLLVASLLLAASLTKGIPTSLVQLNTGAFIALKIYKSGIKQAFGNKTIRMSFIVWLIAPLFAFISTFLLIKFI
jgi:sulfate permease